MIPFLPTLANSDPWLTTNSFCSESSSTLTSMPWGERLGATSFWAEEEVHEGLDKVKVGLVMALLLSKKQLTLGSYSAFTVTGCLYTSSDPPSSSSLSKIIAFQNCIMFVEDLIQLPLHSDPVERCLSCHLAGKSL